MILKDGMNIVDGIKPRIYLNCYIIKIQQAFVELFDDGILDKKTGLPTGYNFEDMLQEEDE